MQPNRSISWRLAAGLVTAGLLALPSSALAEVDRQSGTPGDDQLQGTQARDRIVAKAGNDKVEALAGFDRVLAGPGNDTVNGGDGHDLIRGGTGDDTLNGDAGPDRIFAGPGVDTVDGGAGPDDLWALARTDVEGEDDVTGDTLTGGEGDDRFHVRDGERDAIDCGEGTDVVLADTVDEVTESCETVRRAEPKRGRRASPRDGDTSESGRRAEPADEGAEPADEGAEPEGADQAEPQDEGDEPESGRRGQEPGRRARPRGGRGQGRGRGQDPAVEQDEAPVEA